CSGRPLPPSWIPHRAAALRRASEFPRTRGFAPGPTSPRSDSADRIRLPRTRWRRPPIQQTGAWTIEYSWCLLDRGELELLLAVALGVRMLAAAGAAANVVVLVAVGVGIGAAKVMAHLVVGDAPAEVYAGAIGVAVVEADEDAGVDDVVIHVAEAGIGERGVG